MRYVAQNMMDIILCILLYMGNHDKYYKSSLIDIMNKECFCYLSTKTCSQTEGIYHWKNLSLHAMVYRSF